MGNWNLYHLLEQIGILIANVAKEGLPVYNLRLFSCFEQEWDDTSLGFGGLAGQAFTSAFTVVLEDQENGLLHVYIGGRKAYSLKRPNPQFYNDLATRSLKNRGGKEYYET